MSLFNQPKNYYQAVAVLIGQIIGVGIFGMPFLFAKAGMLSLFFFIIFIGLVQYFIHLIYANLVIVTPAFHQLPGYTGIYLGQAGKNLVFVANLVGIYCALLAYTIVSGVFLYQLLAPIFGGNEFIYATIIFSLEAIIIFFGVHVLARVELVMTAFLLLAVSLITWRSFGLIHLSNYVAVNWKYFLIPYGAMLFTLDGTAVIPFIVELLGKDKDKIKSAIRVGVFIPTLVTAIFALVIIGISGVNTTPNALVGVKPILHSSVIYLSLLFGILCIFTSFIGSAQSLRKIYHWDYKMDKHLAWFFTIAIPFLLYLAGIKNFINVISFAGAVAGGIISIALILMVAQNNSDPSKCVLFRRQLPATWLNLLVVMFAAGIILEILSFVLK